MNNGDYLYQPSENGTFDVCRLLRLDIENGVAHVIIYESVYEEPVPETLATLSVLGVHAPIRASSFDGWKLLSGAVLLEEDMHGYYEYLKHTHFSRYLEETGQDADVLIARAKELFTQAYALHGEKDYENAIALYQKAYDVFPLLFEAKDNEAFCNMSLKRFDAALECLHTSIRCNKNTYATDFSVGQCFYHLGKSEQARVWFNQALEYADAPEEMKNAIKAIFAEMDGRGTRH